MRIDELAVAGSYLITPRVFGDDRGSFSEWFRQDALTARLGHELRLEQANWSTSRRGVIRGIHYADVPPGQAKYVTCVRGAVLDVIVDLRVGSPTFGRHDTARLDAESRRAVYLAEGMGHGFCALTDDATVLYLCSTGYNPAAEPPVSIRWMPSWGCRGRPTSSMCCPRRTPPRRRSPRRWPAAPCRRSRKLPGLDRSHGRPARTVATTR
ncbi:MAG: dTDP-4-dehydrorhamnose 3,5-epimerase [Kineosporiaceae bacterium]